MVGKEDDPFLLGWKVTLKRSELLNFGRVSHDLRSVFETKHPNGVLCYCADF